jgi:fatty-acyl-CoA synthase
MNVGDWITKRSILSPNKTAIISDERKITYRELNDRVNCLANALINEGIHKGDRVAALLYNCPEFIEVYFALAKIGAIFVTLNFRLAGPEIQYMITDSESSFLIFDEHFSEMIDSIRSNLSIDQKNYVSLGNSGQTGAIEYERLIEESPAKEPEIKEEVQLEDPQMIMYTSGTTGIPKGALLSHQKTFYNTFNAVLYFDMTSNDIMLVNMPLFHSGGLNISAVPILYTGGTAIIQKSFDPQQALSLIEKHRITLAMMVPTMINFMLKQGGIDNYDLSSMKTLMVGGEPISLSLIKAYQDRNIPIRQVFGQTETSIQLWLSEEDAIRKIGSVGKPVFHADVRVVDKSGKDVVPGEVGEIVLNGPTQMLGYWNDPKLTAETIKAGWLHTGDLATVDEEGFVSMVDREKDMYISGGENVYPAETERVLGENPKILEVAIIGVPDEKWGEVGKALIVLKDREKMTKEEALEFLRGKLAKYKIPKFAEFTNEFPKTGSGKIKKTELREKYGHKKVAERIKGNSTK